MKWINKMYDEWCKETKRNGSILVGSMREFFDWLETKYQPQLSPSNTVEEDAVGFAQHILDLMDENVLSTSNGLIRYNNAYYTIKDLYSLFKQSKEKE